MGHGRLLEKRFDRDDIKRKFKNVSGVVAVSHTEAGANETALEAHRGSMFDPKLVLRTLAGFVVHPNVGAVVLVDVHGPRNSIFVLANKLL